jgi:outer membrane autotransporter protein
LPQFSTSRPSPARPRCLLGALLASTALLSPQASAAEWIGPSGSWSDPANWDTNAVPGASDEVVIAVPELVSLFNGPEEAQSVRLGPGQMVISSGGTLFVYDEFIASGDNVRVTVTGTGSGLTVGGELDLGEVVTFFIEDGADVDTSGVVIGSLAGAAASASVFDARWNNGGAGMVIGENGDASLGVYDTGSLDTGTLALGQNAGSSGRLTVGDTASVIVIGGLTVGSAGEGAVTVQGTLATGATTVGISDSDNRLEIVSGSWTNAGIASIGSTGTGRLDLGSASTAQTQLLVVGDSASSQGTVEVDEASELEVGGVAVIGNSGTGSILVNDASRFTGSGAVTLGQQSGGVGTVDLVDSSWYQGGSSLVVGGQGEGLFTLDNSEAEMSYLSIADDVGSTGRFVLTGGSIADVGINGAAVGHYGQGTMLIEDDSTFTSSGGLRVGGLGIGGEGEVLVTGSLSRLDVTGGTTIIGSLGTGTIRLEDEALLTSEDLNAGGSPGGTGSLVIAGGGWFGGGDSIFGDGGIGSLVIEDRAGQLGVIHGGNMQFGGTIGGQGILDINDGAIAVGGNFDQYGNSTLRYAIGSNVSVATGITVSGIATIHSGATLDVVLDGSVQAGDEYVVLVSTGGAAGNYTLVNDGRISAFLDVDALYETTLADDRVTLVVTQATSFAGAGLTPNQQATGGGIETLGAGNDVYETILMLGTEAEARAAFDLLSGEIHATAQGLLLEAGIPVRSAMVERLWSNPIGSGNKVASASVVPDEPGTVQPGSLSSAWAQGFGVWSDAAGDGNAAASTASYGGLLVGMDSVVRDWRIGLIAGYGRAGFQSPARQSTGTTDTAHLGAYAGSAWGPVSVRTGVSGSFNAIETTRDVTIAGLEQTLSASYGAAVVGGFGELGYQLDLGGATVEPFVNLTHVASWTGGYDETGGSAALSADSRVDGATFTTIGFRGESRLDAGGVPVTVDGSIGWRHAFADSPSATHSFAGGDAFTVDGTPLASDLAVMEAGIDLSFSPAAQFGVSYSGQFSSDTGTHAIKAGFSGRF